MTLDEVDAIARPRTRHRCPTFVWPVLKWPAAGKAAAAGSISP
jgi:hypothetical protein